MTGARERFDCLVIGGGPAGSTAATLLARAGLDVCIVEKDTFPRFHIGESLLPAGNRVLRRIGVWPAIEQADFVPKYGAEFTSSDGGKRVHIRFSEGLVPEMDYTYQVRRAEFDALLLNHAAQSGCHLLQPAQVKSVTEVEDGFQVVVEDSGGERTLCTNWLLDAGGRGRFLGTRLGIPKEDVPLPRRFAVYSHFKGVDRRAGAEAGNIIVTRTPDGWFWSIPLSDQVTSVGLVCTRRNGKGIDPVTIFHDSVKASPFMAEWMRAAESIAPFHTEADYSFVHTRFAGSRWLMLGDAAGFIDPVFSSGVYLGLSSAERAADAVLQVEKSGEKCLSPRAQKAYTRAGRQSMDRMLALVQSFYDPRDFAVFMQPKDVFSVVRAVNSIVAGNTQPNFSLRWRFGLFRLICRINRLVPLVSRQAAP